MTEQEFESEASRLAAAIAIEDAGKKDPQKPLAEKVGHNRARNRLREQLRQHKLNYFELVKVP